MTLRRALLAAALFGLLASGARAATPVLTVQSGAPGRAIPAGFLGLSFELTGLEPYTGTEPGAIDPVFKQLIRNLTSGQRPIIRVGGDSTDWSWWPVPGMTRPPGVWFGLSEPWLRVTAALARDLNARLILGIDLEADSSALAAVEAGALAKGIGAPWIEAIELGNEPELYGSFTYYTTPAGASATGRPRGYDMSGYIDDLSAFAPRLPPLPLAGPATGGRSWDASLGELIAAQPRLGLLTVHRYPLQLCWTAARSPVYPTIGHLLSPASTAGLARSISADVQAAHGHGLALRVDEMNTISCGSDDGVAKTFASALWALDALFAMAHAGADGVNIHSFPGSTSELFQFAPMNGSWRAAVDPEYYGLLAFARAAPPGSRIVPVGGISGIRAWATRDGQGAMRLVLINVHARRGETVAIRGVRGTALLERLVAPSLAAAAGVTLAGQSFGRQTWTGLLAGDRRTTRVVSGAGLYRVTLPPASAAILTFAGLRSAKLRN